MRGDPDTPPPGLSILRVLLVAAAAELLFDVGFNAARGSAFVPGYIALCLVLSCTAAVVVATLVHLVGKSSRLAQRADDLAIATWAGLHGLPLQVEPVLRGATSLALAVVTYVLVRRRGLREIDPLSVAFTVSAALSIALILGPFAISAATTALSLPIDPASGQLAAYVLLLVLAWAYVVSIRHVSLPPLAASMVLVSGASLAFVALVVEVTRPVVSGFPPSGSRTQARGSPNIVVIVLDTVRADHTSIYGYERRTTPGLEAFVRRYPSATIYPNAFAPSNWTAPSHASLLTGLMPSAHHVHSGTAGAILRSTVASATLRADRTLAEALRRRGYRTAAIVANAFLLRIGGLQRGFDLFVKPDAVRPLSSLGEHARAWLFPGAFSWAIKPYPAAGAVFGRALGVLSECDGGGCFVVVNLMEAHSPYLAPREFAGSFSNDESTRPYRDASMRDSEGEIARKVAGYDEEILGLDAALSKFLTRMERSGLVEDAWIFITSDHGEAFGEHGSASHGSSVYNEQIRVPLVVKPPLGVELPEPTGEPVGLLDVASTIGGIGGSPSFGVGHDLRSARASPRMIRIEFYGELRDDPERYGKTAIEPAQAVVGRSYKLIAREGRRELYDVLRDPGERSNLAGSGQSAIRRLATRLIDFDEMRSSSLPDVAAPGIGQKAELEALGYITDRVR